MNKRNLACIAGLLLASASGAAAATTLTAWTFDNVAIGPNSSPLPSAGFGAAAAIGMGSGSNPDVQSLAGSSSGGPNSWRIRATGGSNGWSTNASIGSQGARFAGSTAGYYKLKVSFDVYATSDAEANLQVQYTTEGAIWKNITNLTSAGAGVVTNNSATNSTVLGGYISLASGWNNQLTADLTGISGVDNNANFAVRIVNASTGTNCVDTTGAPYNNTSGSWTFDNVVIQGVSIDTVAQWTFESQGVKGYVPNPAPEFGSGTAKGLGMDNSYLFSDGSVGSTNKPDTLNNGAPFSSSGSSGQVVWRVRGAGGPDTGHNGWNYAAPIGTQGAEFDVSTVNYNDVVVSFDMYVTSQGEAKMCVQYTTDAWATTNTAQTLAYPANPTFILANSGPGASADTVDGTYFYETTGQNFYNNFVVDFTGVAGAANNANFGFRVVNAAQGSTDCVAFNAGSYNNSSGNWRFDNVTIGGTFIGSVPPVLAYDPNATVDRPFTNTFTDDPTWRSKITAVYVNGSLLASSAYNTNLAGQLVFTPSQSALLKTSGAKSIAIYAAGYGNAKFTQPLAAGVATKLAIPFQPIGPSASGGTLIVNPSVAVTDQYGNGAQTNFTVTATVGGAGGWTLGGSTVQPAVGGFANFSNLTASVNGATAVGNASITFNVAGYPPVTTSNSAPFIIGAPPAAFTPGNLAVLQIDSVSNNTTFSIIEVKPSSANQTTPVNIVPISATGTNGLRQSSAGSTGRVALSDDGTLVCFAAFLDDNSVTLDETFNLERAAAGLNYTNQVTLGLRFTSTSLGGSQARACATLDNLNWIADDKAGLFYGSTNSPAVNINGNNNVVVKTFGGTPYVETQKTAGGSPIPVVYALDPNDPTVTVPNNLGTDPVATDFYMISTNGTNYGILYIIDQVSSSQGIIRKYSWVPDDTQISGYGWTNNGAFTNGNGGDGLFAATNGNGAVYLFYTTGGGGSGGNSIVRLTDASGWDQPMNIISSNVVYTAASTNSIKGLTFVPMQNAHATAPVPPPILTAQTGANVGGPFSVTNTPDDPAWRSAISSITVNGSVLPPAAYDKTQAGKIVFTPSQSTLLQTNGAKAILITATGYSADSVTQVLAPGPATKLVIKTQPTAPLADGGALATQPVLLVQDQFNNIVTNSTASVTASAGQGTWTLGGTVTKSAVGGTNAFTNLTAFSVSAVAGATISFTSSPLTGATSSSFNIPAPILSSIRAAAMSAGKFTFSFTNLTGLSYSVLATNNLAAPVATWPVIGTVTESPAGSGTYRFTNSPAATNAQQFYILRQP